MRLTSGWDQNSTERKESEMSTTAVVLLFVFGSVIVITGIFAGTLITMWILLQGIAQGKVYLWMNDKWIGGKVPPNHTLG